MWEGLYQSPDLSMDIRFLNRLILLRQQNLLPRHLSKKLTMMLPKLCRWWTYTSLILWLLVQVSQLRTPAQLSALGSKFTSPHVSSKLSLPQFPQFPDPQLDISFLWSKSMKLSVRYTTLLMLLCGSLMKNHLEVPKKQDRKPTWQH